MYKHRFDLGVKLSFEENIVAPEETPEVDEAMSVEDGEEEEVIEYNDSENAVIAVEEMYKKIGGMRLITHNISNESAPAFLVNISKFFTSKLKIVTEAFTNIKNKYIGMKTDQNLHNAFVQELMKLRPNVKELMKKEWSEIESMPCPVVVGMNTNLVEVVKVLEVGLDLCKDNVVKNLDVLESYIQQVLSDPDFRMSSRPQLPDANPIKLEETLYTNLNKVISTKNVSDSGHFRDLFPNVRSVHDVTEKLIELGTGVTLESMRDIESKIANITNDTNMLIEEMNNKDFTVHKNILKKLGTDFESNAKMVTVCVSYIHLYNQCVNTVRFVLAKNS